MFEHIILEPVQEELLIKLVEAVRNVPLNKRQKYFVLQSSSGDHLLHSGLPGGEIQIYFGDVEALASVGLVALGYGSSGTPNFDVTPMGFRYYEYLKKKVREPVERIETAIRNYLNAHDFKKEYPKAFEKWSAAEDLLWRADSQQQLTTIGHLCRESVQEFADALINEFSLTNIPAEKAKVKSRLKTILDIFSIKLGDKERAFLDALVKYWECVIDLIQRQEHGAQKEGLVLLWEDARRVIFQTMVVMFEIDKAVNKK
jgi:hypothetical protein